MEQLHSGNSQLGRLVADALGEIERLGYSRRSAAEQRPARLAPFFVILCRTFTHANAGPSSTNRTG